MASLMAYLRRIARDTSGIAAVEFALIAPVMLLSLLGALELSNSMFADRKVTQAASTLADLVAQDTEITTKEKNTIFSAATGMISSLGPKGTHFRITSIVADSKGKTTVDWSQVHNVGSGENFPAQAKGTVVTVPEGIVSPNGSIILAEVVVVYPSMVGGYINGIDRIIGKEAPAEMTGDWTLKQHYYLKPRRTQSVAYKP